ncbi:MAG: PDZ domain-containing protein [Planctomycetota bacterium]|nr:MAG: PDZ domain-containing protein [Planctomycetota bacterium]REJ88046.1 MAG: PDZ domain-containing protein [Planctomycetota bacterium]REK24207.1 MAG: PDZ domain-containing protein [Planctomycetota bacterium]REK28805.1 MAG: PDZ domain-containing protein [Planctomycetota bacterium]
MLKQSVSLPLAFAAIFSLTLGTAGPLPAAENVAGLFSIEADDPPDGLADANSLLQEASRHMARVAAAMTPSVVHILAEHESRSGTVEETGSGALMVTPTSRGIFVLTNRHVIMDARLNRIQVHLHDGRVVYPKAVLKDAATDVAVLRLDVPDLTPARWGDSDNLDIGHIVLAMGSPFGLSESVTMGIISAKGRRALELDDRREVINQDFLQTDAAINPGNSGGPLVDLQGRVVGVNTAIASQGGGNEGIGFSIPINLVRYIVDQLFEHGRVQRGFLGVRLDDEFDDAAAKRYALDRVRGARVVEVYANTPADEAGVQVNDLILSFDGIPIEDENHLIHLVSLTEVNRRVQLLVIRGGQERKLFITLIERPDRRRSEAPQPLPESPPGQARIETTGLSLHRLDGGLALQLGYARGQQGVLVTRTPDDASDENALHLYDVIEAVARTEVSTPEEFDAALAEQLQGPVVLRVRRVDGNETHTRLVIWNR